MRSRLVFFVLVCLSQVARADSKSEEREAWFAERRAMIVRAKEFSDSQTVEDLSRIVRGVGSNLENASEEGRLLYLEAQSMLLAIPGHAEYFRDRILEARSRLDQASEVGEKAAARSAMGYAQNEGFGALRHLPSVETVRVLGEFLNDDRGRTVLPANPTYDEKEEAKQERPSSVGAAAALQALPLTFKPVKQVSEYSFPYENVHPWQLWYEQVKAGKRTFRFEGDPQEYDLNGPASKDKLAAIAKDRKRDEERSAGHRKTSAPADTVSPSVQAAQPLTAIVIAGGILVAAAWGYHRWKRGAA